MKKAFPIAILFCLCLTNCKQDDKKPLLFGKWQGVSWKVKGVESSRGFGSIGFG